MYKELSKSIRKRPITYLAKDVDNSQKRMKMYFKHVKKHAVLFMPNKIPIKTKGETAFCLADQQ